MKIIRMSETSWIKAKTIGNKLDYFPCIREEATRFIDHVAINFHNGLVHTWSGDKTYLVLENV